MKPRTLAEAKSGVNNKTASTPFKPSARKAFQDPGIYRFDIKSAKYNMQTEILSLRGTPYRIIKGIPEQYQNITVCVATTYISDNGSSPINELFDSFDLDPSQETDPTVFEGHSVSINISISEYEDEEGNLVNIFYNAEGFKKLS